MSQPFCILAIDPGMSGALAFYFPSSPEAMTVEDMPVAGGSIDCATFGARIPRCAPTLRSSSGWRPCLNRASPLPSSSVHATARCKARSAHSSPQRTWSRHPSGSATMHLVPTRNRHAPLHCAYGLRAPIASSARWIMEGQRLHCSGGMAPRQCELERVRMTWRQKPAVEKPKYLTNHRRACGLATPKKRRSPNFLKP
jgi:hypothetical protein